MLNRFLLWLGCLLAFVFLGCVSKTQFNAVSKDYHFAQEYVSQLEDKIEALELSERESKEAERQCREALEKQAERSKSELNALSEENEELNRIVNEKQAIVDLQQTVIRLFDDTEKTIQSSIQEQIKKQGLEAATPSPPRKIVLVEKLLFESSSASLSNEAKALLGKMTGLLKETQYDHIRVQGHTDNSPFRSTTANIDNWTLSVKRAMAVVRFLDETIGVPPERMSVTGFGPYQPISTNDTAEGRKQNRRIEIILEKTKPLPSVQK